MDVEQAYMLAIETSGRVGGVAVGRGTAILGQVQFTAGARHGVELIVAVDGLVRALNLTPDRFRVVCVSAGPGSFTGLRVGFTFARCLAQVTGAKLAAVPGSEVVVENLRPLLSDQPGPVYLAPILDAKRNQVYTAGFRWQGKGWEKILAETVLTPAALLQSLGRPLWITGEGIEHHRAEFENREEVRLIDRTFWFGRAETVLKLGAELARQDRFIDRDEFIPLYVRLPEAEERWRLRQAENKTSATAQTGEPDH